MMEAFISILLLAFLSSTTAMVQPSAGYKYELELKKVLQMNQTDYIKFEGLTVKRFNKSSYVADGQFTATVTFDDTWNIMANCWRDKLGNNQWELTSFNAPFQPVSKFLKSVYFKYMQPDLVPCSNLPDYENEDAIENFPAGTYKLTNYIGDIQNFPPHLQDGLYRIEIFLYKDNVVESGFVIYWKVYPEVG
ncbi:hypothetical protein PVAND_007787 [Polypedilum vanderplanki]|uniref:Uncharacterized protein n=1 Tax=Polypedilum vanderplanki TaxID=319348 RepID=A0A9J6C816_POLVA|nr:hypothetical protein PVAND_007787 [Polypedilum vanderplanki]